MKRAVFKTTSFRLAESWDIRQALAMSPRERVRIASLLRKRAYPGKSKDVRACHGVR